MPDNEGNPRVGEIVEQVEEPVETVAEPAEAVVEPEPVEEEIIPLSTVEANGDDLSDLFKGPSPDDPSMQTADLMSLDEEDVYGDGGENMDDLFDVDEEDIMGEKEWATPPPPPKKVVRVRRLPRRYAPPQQPTTLGGMGV